MSDIEDLARRLQDGMGERSMTRLPKLGSPERERDTRQGRINRGQGGSAPDPRDHSEVNSHARDLSRRGLFQITDEEREAADRERAIVAATAKAKETAAKELNRLTDILGNTITGLGGMAIAVEDYVRIADLLNGGNGMRRTGGRIIGRPRNDRPKKERKADGEHS